MNACQDNVEDTKGNNGDPGALRITNLRLVWVSRKQRRTSLTLGYGCITAIDIKNASSRLKGRSPSLVSLYQLSCVAMCCVCGWSVKVRGIAMWEGDVV